MYDCGVVNMSAGTGWTIYISGSTTILSSSAITATVVQLPINMFNAVLTTQTQFNALSVDGYYINQVSGLTGLTGATFGCSILRLGGFNFISLSFNQLPPTVNVLNGSVYDPWVKNKAISGGWIALTTGAITQLTPTSTSANSYILTSPSGASGTVQAGVYSGLVYVASAGSLIATNFMGTATNANNLAQTVGLQQNIPYYITGSASATAGNNSAVVSSNMYYNYSDPTNGYLPTLHTPDIWSSGDITANTFYGLSQKAASIAQQSMPPTSTSAYYVMCSFTSTGGALTTPNITTSMTYTPSTSTLTVPNITGACSLTTQLAPASDNSLYFFRLSPTIAVGSASVNVFSGLFYNNNGLFPRVNVPSLTVGAFADFSTSVPITSFGISTSTYNSFSFAPSTIVSASTITPTNQIHFISGTTAISTITCPTSQASGWIQITLIPTGSWTTKTLGNIALATTAVANKALILTYSTSNSKWYPSY